ncbi:helix-turn-helix domain-containing protein, partial [Candidatus Omnitrophota bacterium]
MSKDKGFTKLFHEVVDFGYLSVLSHAQLRVYLYCQRYANYTTRLLLDTNDVIAERLGLSEPTITKAVAGLVKMGLLKIWFKYVAKNKTRRIIHVLQKGRITPPSTVAYPPLRTPSRTVTYPHCPKCG